MIFRGCDLGCSVGCIGCKCKVQGWSRDYDVLASEPVEEALAGTPLHRLHLAGAACHGGRGLDHQKNGSGVLLDFNRDYTGPPFLNIPTASTVHPADPRLYTLPPPPPPFRQSSHSRPTGERELCP